MRVSSSASLLGAIGLASLIAAACGTTGSSFDEGSVSNDEQNSNDLGFGSNGGDPSGNGSGNGNGNAADPIESARIEPADAVIYVEPGKSVKQTFKLIANVKGRGDVDLTSRSVFYVPDNFLVGGFPANGGPVFTSRLPSTAYPQSQRGGTVTVRAQIANADDSVVTVTTSLTVVVKGGIVAGAATPEGDGLPQEPWSKFSGEKDLARAPVLYYPNDGVLLPPNLRRLEVHWRKGSENNDLFQISFVGKNSEISYYTRCTNAPTGFEAGAFDTSDSSICAIRFDDEAYDLLAESNRGLGSIKMRVRGADSSGTSFGESDEFTIEFAENRVDGGVYYWSASSPESIVRFDFGNGSDTGVAETYLKPNSTELPGSECVGCHSLSRDGTKLFAGRGNSGVGNLVFVSDVKNKTVVRDGTDADSKGNNRVLLGSFDPTGNQFVVAAPKAVGQTSLHFHNTTDGKRDFALDLGKDADNKDIIPSHPDWSPDGKSIAFTRINGSNSSSIEFFRGEIDVLRHNGVWSSEANPTREVVVPAQAGTNRYNPAFLPDGSLLLYTESASSETTGDYSCTTSGGRFCNGYSDPLAKTWAVAPTSGATPIFLENAARPGVADAESASAKQTDLMDTFPRATPFKSSHQGKSLTWFTISSQRRAGLRKEYLNKSVVDDPDSQALLWMFALYPDEVLAGTDGSRTGFFLPFQDLKTSNHMAQWTEKLVTDTPANTSPPPVPPPPPPPPPAGPK